MSGAVLVTGGTGDLGGSLVGRLVAANQTARIMSRRPMPTTSTSETEWVQASLATGDGLSDAVDGIECVVHCASSPFQKTWEVDVEGTRRLLEACQTARVSHFLYISIVGIDKIPFPYYKHKLSAEQIIEDMGVPYTILRATQFHALLDRVLGDALLRFPIGAVPRSFKFQTIDAAEVANRMLEIVEAGPQGRVDDIGGPAMLEAGAMARCWAKAAGRRRLVLPLPLVGKVASAFRAGLNCTPLNAYGKTTWAEWLARKYAGEATG